MTEKSERSLSKQVSLLKSRSPKSIGIDSQDARSGIRRMKTDKAHILRSNSCNNDDEVNMAEGDEYIYLDSCASKRLFILRDLVWSHSFGHGRLLHRIF